MKKTQLASRGRNIAALGIGLLASNLKVILLRQPFHLDPSPILQYVPLLFWLLETCQPRRAAVLGRGGAFFALCQAMGRLVEAQICQGFGFWEKSKTGKAVIPSDIRDHALDFHPNLTQIQPSTDALVALQETRPASLDLLRVDFHAIPEGDDLIANLPASLRAGGILVLHMVKGIMAQPENKALTAFFASPARLELEAGEGLILLPKGSVLPAALAPLSQAAENGTLTSVIAQLLRWLGGGSTASAQTVSC